MVKKLTLKVKVLLLNPFLEVFPDDPAGINPALGLAYLASYLEQKKVEVSILDLAAEGVEIRNKLTNNKVRIGLSEHEIKKRIKLIAPQIVGITCQSTLHAKEAHDVAKVVKGVDKDIFVVMGGAHPSAVPDEVLKDKNVDIVVFGEGEITLWEIVNKFEDGKKMDNILGTCVRQGNKVVKNPPRPFIQDLDCLPFPARHLLPIDIFFSEAEKSTSYNIGKHVMTLISSRGCPGNCIYCAVKTVWGRAWRGRSPKNVVDEIELLIKAYKADEVHFLDDSISVDKKRLEGICDEIIKRKIKIRWTTPNGIAVWLLDKDLLLKMKKAGCYRLTFGLESGDKKILKEFIGKNYDYGKAKETIRFASKLGLWTLGTFIIGFPEETRGQINETIKFAVSTDLDFATFYIANPFPGTRMYDIYKRKHLLPKTGAYQIVRGCRTENFSHEELVQIQSEVFKYFLTSRVKKPYLFLRKLREPQNWFYLLQLAKNSFSLFSPRFVKEKGIAALWKKN